MINTTPEYNQYIYDERFFYHDVKITLKNSTVLNITNEEIMDGGFVFEDAVCDNTFNVGGVIINQFTLVLDNSEYAYNLYDFNEALVEPSVGLQLSLSIETLNKGKFIVDKAEKIGNRITLTCLDYMYKFDKPFSPVGISYPCTVSQVLQSICAYCGVVIEIGYTTFTNSTITISSAPQNGDTLNCREVLGYIAQLSGNFARINISGNLELKWFDNNSLPDLYDGGDFSGTLSPYETGYDVDGGTFSFTDGDTLDGGNLTDYNNYHVITDILSNSVDTDDIEITGIQVTNYPEPSTNDETPIEPSTYLTGTSGYVLSIEENPLITTPSIAQTISTSLGSKLNGIVARGLDINIPSNPAIEAGDVAIVQINNMPYYCYITKTGYKSNGNQNIVSDVETPNYVGATKYSNSTKTSTIVNTAIASEKEARNYAISEIFKLNSNVLGAYKTEVVQPDGSTVYYVHNKSTLATSDIQWKMDSNSFMVSNDSGTTWQAGFDNQGNAKFNILSVIGLYADWIVAGIIKSSNYAPDVRGIAFDLDNSTIDSKNFKLNENGDITATSGTIGGWAINGNDGLTHNYTDVGELVNFEMQHNGHKSMDIDYLGIHFYSDAIEAGSYLGSITRSVNVASNIEGIFIGHDENADYLAFGCETPTQLRVSGIYNRNEVTIGDYTYPSGWNFLEDVNIKFSNLTISGNINVTDGFDIYRNDSPVITTNQMEGNIAEVDLKTSLGVVETPVSFGNKYENAPVVVVTPFSTDARYISYSVGTVTTTKFYLYASRTDKTELYNTKFRWIALDGAI